MTEQEFAAKKRRVRALVISGIAAFLGAYVFRASRGGLPPLTPAVFLAAGVLCFVVAGVIARKLIGEKVSK